MLIIDGHEDLAYNMLAHGRDYTRAATETRRLEQEAVQRGEKEDTLLGWPDYQRGRVALVFATLFASPARLSHGEPDSLDYQDARQAKHNYRQQLDLYHRLVDEHPDKFRLVQTRADLEAGLAGWQESSAGAAEQTGHPVGLVILMEGAESISADAELEEWWAGGLRIIGPAWAGNRFCGGTGEPGGLTRAGFELLEHMADLGFALDVSHMDEAAVLQAADVYPGTIIASHSNARALLKGNLNNRHLTDPVIRALLDRGCVIGILPINRFLQADWMRGDRRELITLQHVVAQIDYICQMAGDARHVGIGTDFDGGFGLQSVPAEFDTIADLQKLIPSLAEHGYAETDIAAILSGNWINRLNQFLPG